MHLTTHTSRLDEDSRIRFAVRCSWFFLVVGFALFLSGIVLVGMVFQYVENIELLEFNQSNRIFSQRTSVQIKAIIFKHLGSFLCGVGMFSLVISGVVMSDIYQQRIRLREINENEMKQKNLHNNTFYQYLLSQLTRRKGSKFDEEQTVNELISHPPNRVLSSIMENSIASSSRKSSTKSLRCKSISHSNNGVTRLQDTVLSRNRSIQRKVKVYLENQTNSENDNSESAISYILGAVGHIPLLLGITDVSDDNNDNGTTSNVIDSDENNDKNL